MSNDNRPNNKGQNKLRTYRTFKTDQLRLSAHHLMIEKGRQLWLNLEDRLCTKCNQNVVENELRAVMNCSAYKSERNDLFNILAKEIKDWNNLSTTNRFIQIMKITRRLTRGPPSGRIRGRCGRPAVSRGRTPVDPSLPGLARVFILLIDTATQKVPMKNI